MKLLSLNRVRRKIPNTIQKNFFLIACFFLLTISFIFVSTQGYWRHDSWVYSSSEFHEITDGKWLAPAMHYMLRGIPPTISFFLSICSLGYYFYFELKRIDPRSANDELIKILLLLSVFTPGILSQLHWPSHSFSASLILVLSTFINHSNVFYTRIFRALFVSIFSMAILSSFAFFSLICFLPELPLDPNRSINKGKLPMCKTTFVYVAGGLMSLGIGYGVSFFAKKISVLFGLSSNSSRLEKMLNIKLLDNSKGILDHTFRSSYQQWGESFLLIIFSFLLCLVVYMVKMKWGYSRLKSWQLSLLVANIMLMTLVSLTMVMSGTHWLRVALSWSFIPIILIILSRSLLPKEGLLVNKIFITLAVSYSTFIGLTNLGIAAKTTNFNLQYIKKSIPKDFKKTNRLVVISNDLKRFDAKYIYGGWPPFSSNKPWNQRINRALEELGYQDYIFCGNYAKEYVNRTYDFSTKVSDCVALKRSLIKCFGKKNVKELFENISLNKKWRICNNDLYIRL